jgi:hypothetical protein
LPAAGVFPADGSSLGSGFLPAHPLPGSSLPTAQASAAVFYSPLQLHKNHPEFERMGLRPLYEAATPRDTLVKQSGDATIELRGKSGARSFSANFFD